MQTSILCSRGSVYRSNRLRCAPAASRDGPNTGQMPGWSKIRAGSAEYRPPGRPGSDRAEHPVGPRRAHQHKRGVEGRSLPPVSAAGPLRAFVSDRQQRPELSRFDARRPTTPGERLASSPIFFSQDNKKGLDPNAMTGILARLRFWQILARPETGPKTGRGPVRIRPDAGPMPVRYWSNCRSNAGRRR